MNSIIDTYNKQQIYKANFIKDKAQKEIDFLKKEISILKQRISIEKGKIKQANKDIKNYS